MKRFSFLILFFLLPAVSGHSAEVVDRVVAVVGGDIVTLSDVKNFSAQHPAQGEQDPQNPNAPASAASPSSKDSKDPLEALIRQKLMQQEIERLQITATEQDIDGTIKDITTRNKITMEQLKGELAKKGINFEKYKKDLATQIEQMKFMGQVIFPRIHIPEEDLLKKMGKERSDEARYRARMEIMQSRAPDELKKYLEEVRAKTYVEIKK
jgi:peptidyl-prolyl cis-trans isomerase SurA